MSPSKRRPTPRIALPVPAGPAFGNPGHGPDRALADPPHVAVLAQVAPAVTARATRTRDRFPQ